MPRPCPHPLYFPPMLTPLSHATISFTGSTSTRERVKTRGHDCEERPRRAVGHPLDVQRKRGKRTLQYLIKMEGVPLFGSEWVDSQNLHADDLTKQWREMMETSYTTRISPLPVLLSSAKTRLSELEVEG